MADWMKQLQGLIDGVVNPDASQQKDDDKDDSTAAAPAPEPATATAPAAAGTDEECEDEDGDVVAPLPPAPIKKPMLNVAKAQEVSASPSAPSTRRRFSARLFSSPPSIGLLSYRSASATGLAATIEAVRNPQADEGDVTDALKRLFAQVPDLQKVGVAAKAGAIEAVMEALVRHHDNPTVLRAIFSPLINLSAGDDAVGMKRAALFVDLGVAQWMVRHASRK